MAYSTVRRVFAAEDLISFARRPPVAHGLDLDQSDATA
jgi:hypothetical protein